MKSTKDINKTIKVLFSLLYFSVTIISAKAQSFTIAADKMNIAYIGIDNPLIIVSDNCSCKDIFATTDNGTLTKGDSCRFNYMPSATGKAIITIQKKQSGKLVKIGEQALRCKYIPDPYPVVGNRQSGTFLLEEFKVQQGVRAIYDEYFDLNMPFAVISFKITLVSKNQLFFTELTNGPRFTFNTINAFKKLKQDDIVLIEDIRGTKPDGRILLLGTLTFVMR